MLTISAIKADVGSIGGHTKPSGRMLESARKELQGAIEKGLLLDGDVTHTGDDICLLMVHRHGNDYPEVHDFAWQVFLAATEIAQQEGLYGAGQDLLKDAPSGNVRGAGPGAAEITFDETAKERGAEPFMVFTADKCGPGAFNFPLWTVFTSPLYCAGLMLPQMKPGFKFTVIDMEHAGADRIIELEAPEQHLDLAVLLRDENRFGIKAIHSRKYPEQQVVAVSTDRLHTIAGEYKGKDDPVAIVRSQGIFPAPEEIVSPYYTAHFVAGDARGSHHMPLMPAPINTAISGPYCLPLGQHATQGSAKGRRDAAAGVRGAGDAADAGAGIQCVPDYSGRAGGAVPHRGAVQRKGRALTITRFVPVFDGEESRAGARPALPPSRGSYRASPATTARGINT